MEIIRRGLILPEEESVANKLRELPDHWWCIGGDGNRFAFKKGDGIQIDFLVISPKGIFLIDAKNIHTIELSDGNTVKFLSAAGKQIRKGRKRDNPIEDILDERYQAKDWLRDMGIKDFLTRDRKEIKVFINGLVVLANENTIYKNCKLDQLSYYTHKYPSLLALSDLTEEFFNSIHLPVNCEELTQEEMWILFKIFYNPDMSIAQLFSQIKREEDTLLQEKQVFLEKMRILEQENLHLNQKTTELEGTRNNLISVNQELTDKNRSIQIEMESSLTEIKHQKELNSKLSQELNELQTSEITENEYREKLEESTKKVQLLQKENKKLSLKKVKKGVQKLSRRLYQFRNAFITTLFILLSWIIYFFIFYNPEPKKDSLKLISNTDELFSSIEKVFPTMQKLYDEEKYQDLINLWQNQILQNKEFDIRDYHRYDSIFLYIAKSFEQIGSDNDAIKYYYIFTEHSKEPSQLLEAYYNRSILYINRKSELGGAYLALKKAYDFNQKSNSSLQEKYEWNVKILEKLGLSLKLIYSLPNAKKEELSYLKIRDFYKEALKVYKKGRDIANAKEEIYTQASFQIEIAHIYMFRARKGDHHLAIRELKEVILLLKTINDAGEGNAEVFEKAMLTYNDIGKSYFKIRRYKKAEQNFRSAIKLSERNDQNIDLNKLKKYEAQFTKNLGELYLKQKKYKQALPILEKAYQIASELKLSDIRNYKKQFEKSKKLAKQKKG